MPRPRIKPDDFESREGEYLRIARRMFAADGFEGITMEKLAAQTDYSKGTIYKHFASKEDVLAALCLESGRERLALLERAARFDGCSRERAIAIAKADYIVFRLHRDYWRTEQLNNVLSLSSKISPRRRAALKQLLESTVAIALEVVRGAISSGDLRLRPGLTPEKVFIGLLGTTRGLYLYCSGNSLFDQWVGDVWATHEQLFGCACDGFGWKPLSSEWDYTATLERVWRDIFPGEAARLGIKLSPASRPKKKRSATR